MSHFFAIFSSTGVKFWKLIRFSWEASQIVRLDIHIEKQNSFHCLGCHHIWEITHAGGNICCFHRFPWSSMNMYPFHYITMSRRSKKYVKLFLIWILVLHRTVWHQFCKSFTIFQNLTPVELKVAKNDTFDLLTITRELDVSDMSNYTFSESLCPEEYISNNFGQI